MSDRIYLDHNATSPLRPQARAAMMSVLDQCGNASSVHEDGRAARRLIEDARERVAGLVGAKVSEVVFTSGATEANNWVLGADWSCIYRAGIEHESVMLPADASGAELVELPVDANGLVDLGAFASEVLNEQAPRQRSLLTLQLANGETGVIQEVAKAASFARAHDIAVHTDAVQACGRVAIEFDGLDVDLLSVSSHKLGGPMGVGALIIRDGFDLPAFQRGGGQERRRRAGTENVAAIAGFGAAAEAALSLLAADVNRLAQLQINLERELLEIAPHASVLGAEAQRLPNTTCLACAGELAETSVIKLDLSGVSISAGSACSSGKVGASHVLTAMGIPPDLARAAIRISTGWNTSGTNLEQFLTRFRELNERSHRAVA